MHVAQSQHFIWMLVFPPLPILLAHSQHTDPLHSVLEVHWVPRGILKLKFCFILKTYKRLLENDLIPQKDLILGYYFYTSTIQ